MAVDALTPGDLDLVTNALPWEVERICTTLLGEQSLGDIDPAVRAHARRPGHLPVRGAAQPPGQPSWGRTDLDVASMLLEGAFQAAETIRGAGLGPFRSFASMLPADAARRCASINSLYYHPRTRTIVDATGWGLHDVRQGIWRANLPLRDSNDSLPLRLSAQIGWGAGFTPDDETLAAIVSNAETFWPDRPRLMRVLRRMGPGPRAPSDAWQRYLQRTLEVLAAFPQLRAQVHGHLFGCAEALLAQVRGNAAAGPPPPGQPALQLQQLA